MFDENLERLNKIAADRMACLNCGWFAAHKDEKIGECHRYPPTFDMPDGEEWKHARTSRDNVCGEFVHKRTGDRRQKEGRSGARDYDKHEVPRRLAVEAGHTGSTKSP